MTEEPPPASFPSPPNSPRIDRPPRPLSIRRAIIDAVLILVVYVAVFSQTHEMGWGLVIGVPFAIGLIVSWTRVRAWIPAAVAFSLGVLIALVTVVAESMFKTSGDFWFGAFCLIIAGVVLSVPYWIGYGLGALVNGLDRRRILLQPRRASAFALGLPIAVQAAEVALDLPVDHEVVIVSRTFDATPHVLWTHPLFDGEDAPVARAPFRLGMTRPVSKHSRGHVKTYRFRKGSLTIRVTETAPERRIDFNVIEQRGVEDRAVKLIGGFVDMVPAGAKTEVTFGATYVPLMRPRILWRPVEHWAASAVLAEALDRKAASAARGALPSPDLALGAHRAR